MRAEKKTRRLAVCALLSALSAILMMTAYFPYFTYCSPLAAGAVLTMIVLEYGKKWAIAAYVAVSVISVLLCEKEAAMMFLMFFGYYPILKAVLEQIRSRLLEYILKLLVFNLGVITASLLTVFLFRIPFGEGAESLWIYAAGLLIAGNIIFFVYDIALAKVIAFYLYRIRPKIRSIIR